MGIWIEAARVAAGVNVLLLAALGWIWLRNYRRHGAQHTLMLLVFAAFLFAENLLWLYLYLLRPDFVGWYAEAAPVVQAGVAMLCVLETVALAFVTRVTWQ